jgi:hypothetical protein
LLFRSLDNLHNIIGLRHPPSLSFAGRNILTFRRRDVPSTALITRCIAFSRLAALLGVPALSWVALKRLSYWCSCSTRNRNVVYVHRFTYAGLYFIATRRRKASEKTSILLENFHESASHTLESQQATYLTPNKKERLTSLNKKDRYYPGTCRCT